MPYADKDKQRLYYREHYKKNKDKIRAQQKRWYDRNREHAAEYQRNYRRRDMEKYRAYIRDRRIKRMYGLTPEQYNALVQEQDGRCGICGKHPSGDWHGDLQLNVDHDHKTGAIRGLLCNKCNRGLGILGDTIETLTAALAYLRRHAPQEV